MQGIVATASTSQKVATVVVLATIVVGGLVLGVYGIIAIAKGFAEYWKDSLLFGVICLVIATAICLMLIPDPLLALAVGGAIGLICYIFATLVLMGGGM